MIDSVSGVAQQPGPQTSPVVQNSYLKPEQVVANLCVASRKRLLEKLSELIASRFSTDLENSENTDISDDLKEALSVVDIFETLHDRERLGCTALGKGIALPHGRIAGLTEPVIAVARLEKPINYDAPDGVPVWIAVCLLVPSDANDVHLQLLASLASRFSDEKFVQEVQSADSDSELYKLFADL
jgi:PTS system nitrogen regulatory IIA component